MIVVVAALVLPPVASSSTPCQTVRVPVALGAVRYEVGGTLCPPGPGGEGRTVQVLVHGFTLSHEYFDPPYQPERYSYVRRANAAGYATLALDRIGVGTSDHPPAGEVTTDSNISVLHQVVEALRAGRVGGAGFDRVVLVGHSYGTALTLMTASRFGGVDAVVAVGFLHPSPNPPGLSIIAQSYPAQLDPAFSSAGLPAGYVTTVPGYRSNFYAPGNVDPAMVAVDERTKQTGTVAEIATFDEFFHSGAIAGVQVPVLVVSGEFDPYFCNAAIPTLHCTTASDLVERERSHLPASPCIEGFVQPRAGHNISLERNNAEGWAAELSFLDRHVGPTGLTATAPAACPPGGG
jgi:pimeloyl-ACP methyl ester carboxylesterase